MCVLFIDIEPCAFHFACTAQCSLVRSFTNLTCFLFYEISKKEDEIFLLEREKSLSPTSIKGKLIQTF